jgi:hypothetical protein
VYFHRKDFDRALEDIENAQALGFAVNPEFLKALMQAAGKKK